MDMADLTTIEKLWIMCEVVKLIGAKLQEYKNVLVMLIQSVFAIKDRYKLIIDFECLYNFVVVNWFSQVNYAKFMPKREQVHTYQKLSYFLGFRQTLYQEWTNRDH